MVVTCPACRHVVDIAPNASCKCPNCGDVVRAPAAKPTCEVRPPATDAAPPITAEAALLMSVERTVSTESVSRESEEVAVVRAAPIIAFVGGLLFFIPFLTQVVGIVMALFAILRPRRPGERVGLAWVGLLMSVAAVLIWTAVAGHVIQSAGRATVTIGGTGVVGIAGNQASDEASVETFDLREAMRSVHLAANAFHRDFDRWPSSPDELAGKSLPSGFRMSPSLIYRPVPSDASLNEDWILIFSLPLDFDAEGDPLTTPHRLVIRLSGKVEFLPADQVESLLQAQPSE